VPIRARSLGFLCLFAFAASDGVAEEKHEVAAPAGEISSNPGASNIITGIGALGHLMRFGESGVQLGGLWIGDGNALLSGGTDSGAWSFASLLIVDLTIDLRKALHIPGAMVGAEFLQFDGQDANGQAGSVTGYNSLPGPPPLNRSELYQVWWRQELFAGKLVFRVGKSVPTYDFNNTLRPVPVRGDPISNASLSALIYAPVFVSQSLLGVLPGYYNSAWGITATVAPVKQLYLSAALFDGNLARGVQTGIEPGPHFNGYYFGIEEVGYSWIAGRQRLPGTAALGAWMQTGELSAGGVSQNGAAGIYAFASQKLWGRRRRSQSSTITSFVHLGINNSQTMPARGAVGGGVTAFALVPRRPGDSFGLGVDASWLNRKLGFGAHETLIQTYYNLQLMHVDAQKRRVPDLYLQPTLTVIPDPGLHPGVPTATALTMRVTLLF
jgi:porin